MKILNMEIDFSIQDIGFKLEVQDIGYRIFFNIATKVMWQNHGY